MRYDVTIRLKGVELDEPLLHRVAIQVATIKNAGVQTSGLTGEHGQTIGHVRLLKMLDE